MARTQNPSMTPLSIYRLYASDIRITVTPCNRSDESVAEFSNSVEGTLFGKSDALQVDSLFWTMNKFCPGHFDSDICERVWLCGLVNNNFGWICGEIPSILGATAREGTKTSGILCLLDIDSCGEPIWLSKRSNTLIILEMWCVHITLVARNNDIIIYIFIPHECICMLHIHIWYMYIWIYIYTYIYMFIPIYLFVIYAYTYAPCIHRFMCINDDDCFVHFTSKVVIYI